MRKCYLPCNLSLAEREKIAMTEYEEIVSKHQLEQKSYQNKSLERGETGNVVEIKLQLLW